MLANLPGTIQQMCSSTGTSQARKRHVLQLLHAMEECQGEICDLPSKQAKYVAKLLKRRWISDEDFCRVVADVPLRFPVPRSMRLFEQDLKATGLSMEDLKGFDQVKSEQEMKEKMHRLWLKSNRVDAHTFAKVLGTLFAMEADNEPREKQEKKQSKKEKRVLTPEEAFRNGTTNVLESFRAVSVGAFAVLIALYQTDQWKILQTQGSRYIAKLYESVIVPTIPLNDQQAKSQLHELLTQFIQTRADESLPQSFWDEFNFVMDQHFGKMVLSYLKNKKLEALAHLALDIFEDVWWNVIYEMMQYKSPVVLQTLYSSFHQLSEDLLILESYEANQESSSFLLKWSKLKTGIIARVWFSIRNNNSIKKLRSLLRLFPQPYTLRSNNVTTLLLNSKQCQEWELTLEKESESPVGCGCNCLCSSKMGIMLANEIGLLGKSVHVVTNPGHIYLVVGDRHTEWSKREVRVIETTSRNRQLPPKYEEEECARPLQSFIEFEQNRPEAAYGQDELVPNYHEFYMMKSNGSFRKESIPFRTQFLINRSTNFWGSCALLPLEFDVDIQVLKRMTVLLEN